MAGANPLAELSVGDGWKKCNVNLGEKSRISLSNRMGWIWCGA
jgi:hypothetical protein